MVLSRDDLLKKGWTEEEIDYTFNVIDKSAEKRSAFIRVLDGVISWFGLIIVFAGSLVLSVVLMPFFITVHGFFLYFMVCFMALILGIVFNILIDQINQVGKELKILGEIILPVIAIIDVYVMIGILSVLVSALKIDYVPPNQYILGAIYVVSLAGPFYFSHFEYIKLKYFGFMSKSRKNINKDDMQQSDSMQSSQSGGQYISQSEYNQNTVSQDYYDAYMQQQRIEEAKKMLYQKKLREQLIRKLGK
jgi:hypothetical protein